MGIKDAFQFLFVLSYHLAGYKGLLQFAASTAARKKADQMRVSSFYDELTIDLFCANGHCMASPATGVPRPALIEAIVYISQILVPGRV